MDCKVITKIERLFINDFAILGIRSVYIFSLNATANKAE